MFSSKLGDTRVTDFMINLIERLRSIDLVLNTKKQQIQLDATLEEDCRMTSWLVAGGGLKVHH